MMRSGMSRISSSFALAVLAILCGLSALTHPAAAQETLKTHSDKKLGIRFQYPARFVVGAFKRESYPAEMIERGFDPPFKNSIVLVEPGQLLNHPRDAIPGGEIPALWLDVLSGTRAEFTGRQFLREPYRITLGGHTAYRLPGFPGPYGDQAHYYLLPLANGNILEVSGHRYYFRDAKDRQSGNPPETRYGKVIEAILQSLETDTRP